MKKLLLPLLFLLTSCTSVRFVSMDHGRILDNNGRTLNILGRPRMTCYNVQGQIVADGLFVGQTALGSFVIDEYGKDFILVENPVCQIGNNND